MHCTSRQTDTNVATSTHNVSAILYFTLYVRTHTHCSYHIPQILIITIIIIIIIIIIIRIIISPQFLNTNFEVLHVIVYIMIL